VNQNWFNRHSLLAVNGHLIHQFAATEETLDDCRDTVADQKEWHELCVKFMKLNCGMSIDEWCALLEFKRSAATASIADRLAIERAFRRLAVAGCPMGAT